LHPDIVGDLENKLVSKGKEANKNMNQTTDKEQNLTSQTLKDLVYY